MVDYGSIMSLKPKYCFPLGNWSSHAQIKIIYIFFKITIINLLQISAVLNLNWKNDSRLLLTALNELLI